MNTFKDFDESWLIIKIVSDPGDKFDSLLDSGLRVSGIMENISENFFCILRDESAFIKVKNRESLFGPPFAFDKARVNFFFDNFEGLKLSLCNYHIFEDLICKEFYFI